MIDFIVRNTPSWLPIAVWIAFWLGIIVVTAWAVIDDYNSNNQRWRF